MRLSVPCNFDEALLEGLRGYPVTELYGKVTVDYAGGGRPSFYIPRAGRREVARFVELAHREGYRFNYLVNASCMGNAELTRQGQRAIRELLDWVCEIGCDSVTVGNIYLLQLIKRCYPQLKVRVSAHRFTDSPRKARFWEDHGADCIVLNETAFVREFALLKTIREAVRCDLQIIVNNSCRQDCAIAGTHAASLSHASHNRKDGRGTLPLDYHMLFCVDYRLREPVNFLRTNWVRPEDLHHYEAIGIDYFKIVERNTPTPELLRRVRAYATRRYDGNLLDLVLPFGYPECSYDTAAARDAYSVRRAVRYFFKPTTYNVAHLVDLVSLGKKLGMQFPRRGPSPLYLDNRKLDGFLDRFLEKSCIDVDCETCRYCHRWAERALRIDPTWRADVLQEYRDFFDDIQRGRFFFYGPRDVLRKVRKAVGILRGNLAKRGAGRQPAEDSDTAQAAPGAMPTATQADSSPPEPVAASVA